MLFLVISVIRADSTTPKITMSQCHSVTGRGGSVISVTRCDKVGHKWDKEIKEVKEIKDSSLNSLTALPP